MRPREEMGMEMLAMDGVTCGELLIDFVATEVGATPTQASLFQYSRAEP